MNIEDCEVGMKVIRRKRGKTRGLKEGEEYTIKRIYKNSVWIKENPGVKYLLKYFEPANKFKVGDKVLYKAENSRNYKCTIFGVAEQKDKFDGKYAISFEKGSGRKVNKVVKERELFPLKKKDELKVGDKFKDYSGNTVKVLARENNPVNITYYFGRTNSENIDVWTYHDVREIIYD